MMRRQALRASVALVASLGVHFAAAMVAAPTPPPLLVAGGQAAEIAALGSSFEDLLQGSDRLQPAQAAEARPVVPADTVTPEMPQTVRETVRPAVTHAAAVTPVRVPTVSPAAAAVVATPTVTGSVPLPPLVAEPALTEWPTEVAALAPSQPDEVVKALSETPPIPVPAARPARPEDAGNRAEAKQSKQKKLESTQAANTARGNADRNARAGQAEGRAEAKAETGGGERGGNAARAGNAAASNYPGKVFSKIRRTRQKRADGTGVARIRFAIAPNGALASVSVASSSGSSLVDGVALDHIRRSAPFPPPPAGAQRKFLIPVEVRR